MSLRARLAAAFFVLVAGPAIMGAVTLMHLVRADVDPPGPRSVEAASESVRVAVAARCHALAVTAQSLALRLRAAGEPYGATPSGEYGLWALCEQTGPALPLPAGSRFGALAARAEIRGDDGTLRGYAYALQPLDGPFLRGLSGAAGVEVGLAANDAPAQPGLLGPSAGQPLPLLIREPEPDPPLAMPHAAVIAAVAGLVAGVLAWWLAGLAIRPLTALLRAVERAASGDLSARTGITGRNETARLGAGVDRLIARLEEAQWLSLTDPLTGLGNLRHLRESLRVEVERAARFGRMLGVLMMDLDHFKAVNDQFGHRAGDDVLIEFARRIRGAVREVDLAFRHGGEEFVVLLPETDVAGSLTVAQRINDAVRERPFIVAHHAPGAPIAVTVSIGIAVYPRHATTAAGVLDAADEALYAAKAAGRDTYVLASRDLPGPRTARSALVSGPDTPVPVTGGASDDATSAQTRPGG